jgi:hypothetical protein
VAAASGFSSPLLTDIGSQSLAATTALYIRGMDQSAAELVPGGEAADNPFFSPDGQWLGWFSKGFMRKARLGGGAPVTLCEISDIFMGGAGRLKVSST